MAVSNFKMPEDVNVLKENLGCADVSFLLLESTQKHQMWNKRRPKLHKHHHHPTPTNPLPGDCKKNNINLQFSSNLNKAFTA